MIICASFPPMGIVLVRMSPRNIFLSVFDRFWSRTEPKRTRFPDLSPEVADTGLEADLLQGAVFLLPFGVEEVQSDALEEGLGLWQVQSLKRFLSGLSGWRGITFPKRVCTCKAAQRRLPRFRGTWRIQPRSSSYSTWGFAPRGTSSRTFLKRNKYLSSCYHVYLPIGIVPGVDIIGYSVPKHLCPCFVESRGAKHLAIGNRG